MKKIVLVIIVFFILAACGGNAVPIANAEPTPTQIPTNVPTIVVSSATVEVTIPTATATGEVPNPRFSPIDGMPQMYIPEGMFRMGGMDARSAPDERPAHDVTLNAYWMDQLEVTNAIYLLCVQSGPCKPPQDFKSQRRPKYFNNPEFNDYPVIY